MDNPNRLIEDAEFLTDEDIFRTVKPNGYDEEKFLTGLATKLAQSSLKDDFSGGYSGNNKAQTGMTTTMCTAGVWCSCRNQRSNQKFQSKVTSPAVEWYPYCYTAEEMTVKNLNNVSGYYNHQSLPYQKLRQLKQLQLMKQQRQVILQQTRAVIANSSINKNGRGWRSAAWSSSQLPKSDGSVMRAVFIGDQTGKRGSTGTGVFLPQMVNCTRPTTETPYKPSLSTVLVPDRVAQVMNLNLDESLVQPVVRSTTNLNDSSLRQRSNNVGYSSEIKMEQTVNELQLPAEWAY